MVIDANGMDFRALNASLRAAQEPCTVTGCCGQRFLASGLSRGDITIEGVPGNALGAYLNGASITVRGNAQDAVGDTMNAGSIVVHGDIGDAAGYAMRGGRLFVRGNAGYRAGIHMKAYRDKLPVLVIGGAAGSFLGEYQAGGLIAVLGLEQETRDIVGAFPCAGMHGGKLFLRGDRRHLSFPSQVVSRLATPEDFEELAPVLREFCACFSLDESAVLSAPFTVLSPNSRSPYRQMYVAN